MSGLTLEQALSGGRGTERPFCCPSHEDTNASASVNVLKGVWFCYACAAHGTLKDHVPTIEDAISVLAGTRPTRVYPTSWLDAFDADHTSPYWTSRVGVEVAASNRCGTDPFTGAPTYPLRDADGLLVGVVTRHDTDPKYRYPFNVSTSRTLYGPLSPCQVLVLVEGAADVMALQEARLPAGWGAVGCFGAGLHYPQVELVHRMNPGIILAAFDADNAGRAATTRTKEALSDDFHVVSVDWSTVGTKDAGETPAKTRIPVLLAALEGAR